MIPELLAMTIQSIVSEAFLTRVLTFRQQHHINKLLQCGQHSEQDLQSLEHLYAALNTGEIVAGGDSLAVVESA